MNQTAEHVNTDTGEVVPGEVLQQSSEFTQLISRPKSAFTDIVLFEQYQRMAAPLAKSSLVPKDYQDNIANCIIALEIADRLNASPLMVMQNLYIVHGKPGWSGQFIAALINASKRFTPLQYVLESEEKPRVIKGTIYEWRKVDGRNKKVPVEISETVVNKTCYAVAKSKATGEVIKSPTVSIQMAVEEGWYSKDGSKWKTMDEVMLHYRAAAFFGRVHASDLLMGMQTVEEIVDVIEQLDGDKTEAVPETSDLTESLKQAAKPKQKQEPKQEQKQEPQQKPKQEAKPGITHASITAQLKLCKTPAQIEETIKLIKHVPKDQQKELEELASRKLDEITAASE